VKEPKEVSARAQEERPPSDEAVVVGNGSRAIISGADDRRYCDLYPSGLACAGATQRPVSFAGARLNRLYCVKRNASCLAALIAARSFASRVP
jgi:hypothetical protein